MDISRYSGHSFWIGVASTAGGQLCVTRPWEASCMCLGNRRPAGYVGCGRSAECVLATGDQVCV